MKTGWLVPAAVLLCSLATVVACAERVTAPGGSFTFDLPGEWVHDEPVEGLTVWHSTDPDLAAMGVIAVGVALDPDMPVTAQLMDLIKDPEQEFTDARNFRATSVTLLGQPAEFISFVFTDDGTALQAHVLPVPSGQMHTALMVLGPEGTEGLEEAAHAVFCSIGPPGAAPATPGGAPPGPTAGGAGRWIVDDMEEGIGVRFREEQQPGVSGLMRVVEHDGKKASQLLPPTLVATLGARPEVEKWERAEDDRFATCTFRVNIGGVPMRGHAYLSAGPQEALLATVHAPVGTPDARLQAGRQFIQQLLNPEAHAAPAGPAIDPASVTLTRAHNTDRSAWLDVPQGWQVSESQGIIRAVGPEGALIVGMHGSTLTPAGAAQATALDGGAMAAQVGVSEYLPPNHAPLFILPWMGQLLGEPVDNVQVLGAGPMSDAPGFARVHLSFRRAVTTGGVTPMEGLAIVSSAPPMGANTWVWNWTITLMEAKQSEFARVLPLLLRIYSTHGVSQALIAQRMENIHNIQQEAQDIMRDVMKHRSEAADVATRQWIAYIRGSTPRISPLGDVRDIRDPSDVKRWAEDAPGDVAPKEGDDYGGTRELTRDEWLKHVP